MKKFTSIEQFRNVVASVRNYYERTEQLDSLPTLSFIGTVKLHGTNAGIRRHGGCFEFQSKEQVITPSNDNCGFARWADSLSPYVLNRLFDKVSTDPNVDITIYGEWIGPGIQKNCGIHQLSSKQWVIVAVAVNGEYVTNWVLLGDQNEGIYNALSCRIGNITVDFARPQDALPELERLTLAVEEECPWAKNFGISGIGEGIVWTCVERPTDSRLWFKTKGELHSSKNKSGKEVVNVDPQKVESINQCVDVILTEGRLAQGIEHVDSLEMNNLGQYLKWVCLDCMKEEMDTIETNKLEWKEVVKTINKRAKDYFIGAVREHDGY